jgi:hypothetical protein
MTNVGDRRYVVVAPSAASRTFFRLHDGRQLPDALASRCEFDLMRRPGEDEAAHRGVSVRDNLAQALALAREQNQRKALVGSRLPPWIEILEIRLRGDLGQCYAQTFSRGHFTIWGHSDDLASNIVARHPI